MSVTAATQGNLMGHSLRHIMQAGVVHVYGQLVPNTVHSQSDLMFIVVHSTQVLMANFNMEG